MIYTPSKNSAQAFIMISAIVTAGILGSIFLSVFFAVVALLFWIQYTAVLSYLQFAKKRKYKITGLTTFLLNPQFRFFIFIFIAVVGLYSVFYIHLVIAYTALIAWWLFSFNFNRHYRQFTHG